MSEEFLVDFEQYNLLQLDTTQTNNTLNVLIKSRKISKSNLNELSRIVENEKEMRANIKICNFKNSDLKELFRDLNAYRVELAKKLKITYY